MRRLWYTSSIAIGVVIGALVSYDLANADSTTSRSALPEDRVELVRERLPDGLDVMSVTQLVGEEGGIVRFGGHSLELERGAVQRPTLVTLRMVANGHIEVEATALASGMFGRIVNVGERGFDAPVRLNLSYARATWQEEPERFVIVRRLGRDGPFEHVRGSVDPSRRIVTAELQRLAGYALAMD